MRKLKDARSSEAPFIPCLSKEFGLTFYTEINKIVHAHKIPPEIIINIDQTLLLIMPISKYTLKKKGSSHVSGPGTSEHHQITATLAMTMSGSFFPIQLMYQGKTERSHPNYTFPCESHVTRNSESLS